jgi:hypothetical protein
MDAGFKERENDPLEARLGEATRRIGELAGHAGESADVVKTGGHPMLRRSADVRKNSRRLDGLRDRRIGHPVAALAAREYAGQIEPESIHAQFLHLPFGTVHNERGHQRMVAIDRISTARVITVAAPAASLWISHR